MTIFVDTGAWIALADQQDQYHQAAQTLYRLIQRHNISLLIQRRKKAPYHEYMNTERQKQETESKKEDIIRQRDEITIRLERTKIRRHIFLCCPF